MIQANEARAPYGDSVPPAHPFSYLLDALIGVRMTIKSGPLVPMLDDAIERGTAEMLSIGASPIFDSQVIENKGGDK